MEAKLNCNGLKYHMSMTDDGEETEDEAGPKAKRPKRERHEPLILAICTPLMARAHATIPQAAEIMFCDCTSSLDRFNTSLFILSTCHPAGGIPLGILMTSDEKEETIQAALQCLEMFFPKMPSMAMVYKKVQLLS